MAGGPKGFSVTDSTAVPSPAIGSGSDTMTLNVSEDAYQGNAQFTVSVDGKQLGGTFTATALHSAAASQNFMFQGDFGTGQHAVAVNFLNDAYGGSATNDRNLYVNSIAYNGTATGQSAVPGITGPQVFTVSGGTTSSVSETGDHGSLAKTLSQTGSYTVGGDTFVLTAGNAASVTLGTGTSQINFIGASSATLTGGSGEATVSADAGSNKFVAGSGTLVVTGGGGKDAYVFHANGGLLKLEDFSFAKGDTLTVDKALQGAMQQTSDGQGGTMLTFGAGATTGWISTEWRQCRLPAFSGRSTTLTAPHRDHRQALTKQAERAGRTRRMLRLPSHRSLIGSRPVSRVRRIASSPWSRSPRPNASRCRRVHRCR